MAYSITASGVVNVEFNFEDLTLNAFTTEFASFNADLQTNNMPINTFELAWTNSGSVGSNDDEATDIDYINAIVESLHTLSLTLNSIEDRISLHTLNIDFSTNEPAGEIELIDSIFTFIKDFPKISDVKNLALNLYGIEMENEMDSSVLFTTDFFNLFTSIESFTVKMNYMDSLSENRMMAFIKNHAYLKSINLDLEGSAHDFDLRQVMLNKNLIAVKFMSEALYPTVWDQNRDAPTPISNEGKLTYWAQLGHCIKRHPNLTCFNFTIKNQVHQESTNINNALINNFLHEIAYNRCLTGLFVSISIGNTPVDAAQTAITQQHFLENSSLVDLELHLRGIQLQPNAQLRTQTLANRQTLQLLAETPNTDLDTTTLGHAKYIHYFFSQAYQPINMTHAKFSLGYISSMLKNLDLYRLPKCVIENDMLSFLSPKDVCKLSAATGGFFHQKRLEREAIQSAENEVASFTN